jgi:hypothetical protein
MRGRLRKTSTRVRDMGSQKAIAGKERHFIHTPPRYCHTLTLLVLSGSVGMIYAFQKKVEMLFVNEVKLKEIQLPLMLLGGTIQLTRPTPGASLPRDG